MNARETLEAVAAGNLSVDQALLDLKKAPFEDLGYAKVDLHRGVRQGAAEVIYGAGKTAEQITGIAAAMLKNHISTVLITRMRKRQQKLRKPCLWTIIPTPVSAFSVPSRSPPAWAASWWLPVGPLTFPWLRKPP